MSYLKWEIIGIICYNLLIMLIYGLDKWKAKAGVWRISEKALIILAFVLGGVGAAMGMIVFNHKTSKMKFRILVPLAMLLNFAVYAVFFLDSVNAI